MYFAFLINAAFCALNIGLYVNSGHWWNLASGIFSGFVALFVLVMEA